MKPVAVLVFIVSIAAVFCTPRHISNAAYDDGDGTYIGDVGGSTDITAPSGNSAVSGRNGKMVQDFQQTMSDAKQKADSWLKSFHPLSKSNDHPNEARDSLRSTLLEELEEGRKLVEDMRAYQNEIEHAIEETMKRAQEEHFPGKTLENLDPSEVHNETYHEKKIVNGTIIETDEKVVSHGNYLNGSVFYSKIVIVKPTENSSSVSSNSPTPSLLQSKKVGNKKLSGWFYHREPTKDPQSASSTPSSDQENTVSDQEEDSESDKEEPEDPQSVPSGLSTPSSPKYSTVSVTSASTKKRFRTKFKTSHK